MFAACTKDLDTGIGILLDKIEELGIADNTYIFYMADNGAESVRWGRELRNMPLRRGKFTFFEGGIRVPMLAVGPGIKPGSHCKTPVWGCDFLPTIHDLAGIRKPLPNDLDGGSLVPILAGDDQGKVYRRNIDGLVFHCTEGSAWSGTRRQTAIRLGTWKLIKNYYNDGEILLFDLDKDPYEWNNLAEKMPAKRDELLGKMSAYLRRVKAKDATMTPEEIYEMQHAEECVAAKKKGWVGYSKPGAPAEYPIPSFSDEERFPDPYSNAVTPEKDK